MRSAEGRWPPSVGSNVRGCSDSEVPGCCGRHSQAAGDLRGQLWADTAIALDRDALLEIVSATQGIGLGSPLLLGLLESIAAAVTEADDSELAEYYPVLRAVYAPMLASIILAADRGTTSGDAVALPGSASASRPPYLCKFVPLIFANLWATASAASPSQT